MISFGRRQGFAIAVAAMAAVVLLSNILVQHPLAIEVGRLDLADLLTWGAFTYPLAFLVTDLTNRLFGARTARRVVYVGFARRRRAFHLFLHAADRDRLRLGLPGRPARSISACSTRCAGGRGGRRLPSPACSAPSSTRCSSSRSPSRRSSPSSAPNDAFAVEAAPFLGLFAAEAPRWLSWAFGDFSVKLLMAALALIPYRLVIGVVLPARQAAS